MLFENKNIKGISNFFSSVNFCKIFFRKKKNLFLLPKIFFLKLSTFFLLLISYFNLKSLYPQNLMEKKLNNFFLKARVNFDWKEEDLLPSKIKKSWIWRFYSFSLFPNAWSWSQRRRKIRQGKIMNKKFFLRDQEQVVAIWLVKVNSVPLKFISSEGFIVWRWSGKKNQVFNPRVPKIKNSV